MNVVRVFPKWSHVASSGSRNDTLLISSHAIVMRDHFYFLDHSFKSSDLASRSFSLLPLQSLVFLLTPPPWSLRLGRRSAASSGNEFGPLSSSSGVVTRADAKALQALEVIKSFHDFDSVMTFESLASIRKRYSIPDEYTLHAPWLGRPYHPCPRGFSFSIDALETGLRFPLHPIIGECLGWWQISPSQMAPNSWCYIITFLRECRESGIVPTRDLFLSYFRLCKGQGDYYLTTRAGFRVGGATSNNKGWKARFLFMNRHRDWGFGIEWSVHPVSNVPPHLTDKEFILVEWLKGILSASQAIRNLIKEWLVEASLSPVSRGTC
ncbi:hypothetical protein BHM03_00044140 [Ensete ventricosum]|nr:hypothetical protein BHM03_00044140 [Ensete ventricosum]